MKQFSRSRIASIILCLAIAGQAHSIEIAGELFVDMHASTYTTGDATWQNAGTYGDFELYDGGNPFAITIGESPAVMLNGSTDLFVGGDLAPEGLVDENPTRTIEAWVFNPSIASEETIVSWGKRGGPIGTNMAFNYGNHQNFGAVGHWGGGEHDLGWIGNSLTPDEVGAPEAFEWHHVVYTFDGEVTSVYADGELWNDEDTVGLFGDMFTHSDTPIAIGSQWEADGVTPTAGLRGSMGIGQLRIHDEVLSDVQIQANYAEEAPNYAVNPTAPETGPFDATDLMAEPIHRYSFNADPVGDADGATIVDSIGGADGIVLGDGASYTGTRLQLDGGSSESAAYGDLPNGLISGLTDVSIETWVSIDGTQPWSRIWDFGISTSGEQEEPGGSGNGADYFFLSAARGGDANLARVEIRADEPVGNTTIDFGGPGEGSDVHYVVTYDADGDLFTDAARVAVYRDGLLIAEGTTSVELSSIDDVNNWLGRSNWLADANLQGAFDEFRIYDYALTGGEIAGNLAAGPNALNVGGVPFDFDNSGVLDVGDVNALLLAVKSGDNPAGFDVDGDGSVGQSDIIALVSDGDKLNTYVGDANLDGEFNSSDLVDLFSAGEYEDELAMNSIWQTGDFTGDGEFSSSDLVAAFSGGGYEQGPRAGVAAVPEPTSGLLLLIGALVAVYRRRR